MPFLSSHRVLPLLQTSLPLLIGAALYALFTASDPLPVFRLALTQPGVYHVSYAALVEAGLPA